MNETDIISVMNFFEVSRERAIDMLEKGVNPRAIREGYDLVGKEVNRIMKKYNPIFDQLKTKITKSADSIKGDLEQTLSDIQVRQDRNARPDTPDHLYR